MHALIFPQIDPVALSVGPLAIRWYALAYLGGFLLGWWYCLRLARQNLLRYPDGPKPKDYDDYLTWAVIGTVLGGRIGYVLFYNSGEYGAHPLEMLKIWHGGMSFHGGMLGVIGAAWLFTRLRGLRFFAFTDNLACVTPIGLGFGRLANFVNGELFGRASDVPWAMVFPRGGDVPRHPSQIYEAGMEGLALFLILLMLSRLTYARRHPGFISGSFLFLYGMFRFALEFCREPDAQLGFLYGGATMGQMLCVPMVLFGLGIIFWSVRRERIAA